MIFFTSDTHFGHKNIIEYCKRPFETIEEMDETIIANWNRDVTDDDTVYHLGDFGFGTAKRLAELRERLNGKIVLILGNHDKGHSKLQWEGRIGMDEVHYTLEVEGYYLSHFPLLDYIEEEHLLFSDGLFEHYLCGHIHEKWRRKGKMLNVGVDQNDFRPLSIETIQEELTPKE